MTDYMERKVKKLYQEGVPISVIAKELHVRKEAVSKVLRDAGMIKGPGRPAKSEMEHALAGTTPGGHRTRKEKGLPPRWALWGDEDAETKRQKEIARRQYAEEARRSELAALELRRQSEEAAKQQQEDKAKMDEFIRMNAKKKEEPKAPEPEPEVPKPETPKEPELEFCARCGKKTKTKVVEDRRFCVCGTLRVQDAEGIYQRMKSQEVS